MKFLQCLYAKIKSKLNKDMIILVVDVPNKKTIEFKNGSIINCSEIEDGDVIRGKRSKIITPYYDDFDYNEEQLDEAINNLIKK